MPKVRYVDFVAGARTRLPEADLYRSQVDVLPNGSLPEPSPGSGSLPEADPYRNLGHSAKFGGHPGGLGRHGACRRPQEASRALLGSQGAPGRRPQGGPGCHQSPRTSASLLILPRCRRSMRATSSAVTKVCGAYEPIGLLPRLRQNQKTTMVLDDPRGR